MPVVARRASTRGDTRPALPSVTVPSSRRTSARTLAARCDRRPVGPWSNRGTRWNRGGSAEHDADPVCPSIIGERDARRTREGHVIELHLRHPPADTARVLDDDVIPGGVMTEGDG